MAAYCSRSGLSGGEGENKVKRRRKKRRRDFSTGAAEEKGGKGVGGGTAKGTVMGMGQE